MRTPRRTAQGTFRVLIASSRPIEPAAWLRRGMVAQPLPAEIDRALAEPPAALVLDLRTAGPHAEDCWLLHRLLGVPVVAFADAPLQPGEVTAALDRGAAEVVTDGLGEDLLAAQVAAVLRRARRDVLQELPAVITIGEAVVDLMRRRVCRAGQEYSLSRTEFTLLLTLLRANGRACSHAELVARVWGQGGASSEHYLRLYIRYLRQKIEADPRRPRAIINVWGVGYRLVLQRGAELPMREARPLAGRVTPAARATS
jgi:two-component system KDP operon response regulator KdpE